MKKFILFLVFSVIVVGLAFGLFEFSNKYKINLLKGNVSWSVVYKNCKDSVAFNRDENDNIYIAYYDSIKAVKEDGREEILLHNKSFNIENLVCYRNKLYFISNSNLFVYDLESKKMKSILDNIPYEGKYLDRNLIIKDSKLLLSIGSATNSGIAEFQDDYLDDKIPYDKSSMDIVLNGINYGNRKTGAFLPYGNSSGEGQKIKAQDLANACIYEINLDNNKKSLYASGIRNIKGWDYDGDGKLIGIVGGMENSGERPINRDSDYLYQISKGIWYGWPDFSGGDPITSPKFKGEKVVCNLIQNPPNKSVPGPLYQYSTVGAAKYLAIDKDGTIFDKNTKVFFDPNENAISAINTDSVIFNILKLKDNSKINGIRYSKGDIFILDSGIGCIYKLKVYNPNTYFDFPKSVWIFITVFITALISALIYRIKRIK